MSQTHEPVGPDTFLRRPDSATHPAAPGPTEPHPGPDDGWRPPEWLGGYRLVEPLGSGGMGVVYRAEDPRLGRQVAVKVVRPAAAGADGQWRLAREARTQAKVESDHLVPVYAAGEEGGLHYLVMPVLKGRTLARRLHAGPLPPAEVVRVGREAALGLAALHDAGLVHRDVKPANIWLEESGRVRLMDFGLAREVAPADDATRTGVVVGTPAYMAPEQARGDPVTDRTDLFALGCVLYEMATGHRPFPGAGAATVLENVRRCDPPPVRAAAPAVPPRLADLIHRLLAADPEDRPSAAAVAAELRVIADAPRRRLRRAAAGAAGALAVVIASAGVMRAVRPAADPRPEQKPAATPGPGPAVADPRPSDLPPLDPQWVGRVRALPRPRQVEAVRAELMRRNPGYDGRLVDEYWDDGRSVKLALDSDRVTDLSPVRAVPGLKTLECYGPSFEVRGRLASLEPVRGLVLYQAGFSHNPIHDLSPLGGMPLRRLWLSEVEADDFEPVYGLKGLAVLHLTSLSPAARVDVGRLAGLPLEDVWLDPAQCVNFERLRDIPTVKLIRNEPAAEFWKRYDAQQKP